jgi:hypothetical protein
MHSLRAKNKNNSIKKLLPQNTIPQITNKIINS